MVITMAKTSPTAMVSPWQILSFFLWGIKAHVLEFSFFHPLTAILGKPTFIMPPCQVITMAKTSPPQGFLGFFLRGIKPHILEFSFFHPLRAILSKPTFMMPPCHGNHHGKNLVTTMVSPWQILGFFLWAIKTHILEFSFFHPLRAILGKPTFITPFDM